MNANIVMSAGASRNYLAHRVATFVCSVCVTILRHNSLVSPLAISTVPSVKSIPNARSDTVVCYTRIGDRSPIWRSSCSSCYEWLLVCSSASGWVRSIVLSILTSVRASKIESSASIFIIVAGRTRKRWVGSDCTINFASNVLEGRSIGSIFIPVILQPRRVVV